MIDELERIWNEAVIDPLRDTTVKHLLEYKPWSLPLWYYYYYYYYYYSYIVWRRAREPILPITGYFILSFYK
jgi:hypothetical protein